jgi:hypothetical protein
MLQARSDEARDGEAYVSNVITLPYLDGLCKLIKRKRKLLGAIPGV